MSCFEVQQNDNVSKRHFDVPCCHYVQKACWASFPLIRLLPGEFAVAIAYLFYFLLLFLIMDFFCVSLTLIPKLPSKWFLFTLHQRDSLAFLFATCSQLCLPRKVVQEMLRPVILGHLCNHKGNNPVLCPRGVCRVFSPNNFHAGTKMTGISLSPENQFLLFPISPISFTTEIKKFIKYNLLQS